MVSSTCGKCGAVNRHDEDDVPPSGMVVKCSECAAPITVMPDDGDMASLELEDSDLLELDAPDPTFGNGALDLADLPAPARTSPLAGAARGGSSDADLPAPVHADSGADLPAPLGGLFDDADLPAPVARAGSEVDLPAPSRPGSRSGSGRDLSDLPAPMAPRDAGLDLPAPKAKNPFDELPAPKGFDSDLPMPRKEPSRVVDLPAPKGFDADLPMPREGAARPAGKPAKPAGKAAADPGKEVRAKTSLGTGNQVLPPVDLGAAGAGAGDQPFDLGEPLDLGDPLDLGGGEPVELGGSGDLDLGAGDALDLGGPLDLGGEPSGGSGSGGLDLELLDLSPSESQASGGGGLDLDEPLDLGGGPELPPKKGASRPFGLDSLDLDEPLPASSAPAPLSLDTDEPAGDRFGEVDLPGGGDDVVTFGRPKRSGSSAAPPSARGRRGGEDQPLELAASPAGPARSAAPAAAATSARAARRTAPPKAAKKPAKRRLARRQLIALAALGVVVLGAGGFYGWQMWSDSESRSAEIANLVAEAERYLASDAPGHWERAIQTAERASRLEGAGFRPDAIAAEAHFALAVDGARDVDEHIAAGNKLLAEVRKAKGKGVHVTRAEGLQSLAERRPDEALERLSEAARAAQRDVAAQLYSGWAHAAVYRHQRAAELFRKVISLSPEHMAAHYGLARALLELGKREEAEKEFHAVIERSREAFRRDHIGAMIGLAQLAEVDRFSDRENRYLEILQNEAVAEADPRDVARAWALAGDEALRAGRVAVATERYGKALSLSKLDLVALVGQGKVAHAKGQYDTAAERLQQVLSLVPGHVEAALALAEVLVDKGDIDTAANRLAGLFERDPAIEDPALLTRMHLLRGRILARTEATYAAAEEAFQAARSSAPESDVRATLALADLYAKQGKSAEAAVLLEPVRAEAKNDPALAVSLGRAYLATGDLASAEEFFRTAVELRPGDAEARAQLGRALLAAGKTDEAIAALREAYELSEKREDIGLELAAIYEQLERDDDAGALYAELLAGESPSLTARGAAGRFYASKGDTTRAAEIGEQILAEDPKNAAGFYLRGVALLAEGSYGEAREQFGEALSIEALPVYHEAAGRASEAGKNFEDALHQYGRAKEADPSYLAPRVGEVRIRVARREFGEALELIAEAKKIAASQPASDDLVAARRALLAFEGESLLELRDYDEAIAALRAAQAANPDNGRIPYLMGQAHGNLGRTRDAAAAFARATRQGEGDEPWLADAYRRLGYAHRETGNRSGAVSAFLQYLDLVEGDSKQVAEVRRLLVGLQGR